MNDKVSFPFNQANFIKSSEVCDHLVKDPLGYCEDMHQTLRDVFNSIVALSYKHKTIYFSQSTLGKYLGISRQQTNKLIQRLKKAGFISTKYRHMRTCLYRVSRFFRSEKIKSQLSHLFPAFKAFIRRQLTQYNIYRFKDLNNYKKRDKNIPKSEEFVSRIPQDMKCDLLTENLHKIMNNDRKTNGAAVFSPVIEERMKFLHLTTAGKIAFEAFPDYIIEKAVDNYHDDPDNVRKPAQYIYKSCLNLMDQLDLKINWPHVRQLREIFKVEKGAPTTFTPLLRSTGASKGAAVPTVLNSLQRLRQQKSGTKGPLKPNSSAIRRRRGRTQTGCSPRVVEKPRKAYTEEERAEITRKSEEYVQRLGITKPAWVK